MYGVLDISTSGMIAQRTRLAAISNNIANRNTLRDPQGNYDPYRRREVMLAPGDPSASSAGGRAMGVHVAEVAIQHHAIRSAERPGSPHDHDGDGYIMVPDINPVFEQVNAMEAVRAYEANAAAAEATKQMVAQALRLLA